MAEAAVEGAVGVHPHDRVGETVAEQIAGNQQSAIGKRPDLHRIRAPFDRAGEAQIAVITEARVRCTVRLQPHHVQVVGADRGHLQRHPRPR